MLYQPQPCIDTADAPAGGFFVSTKQLLDKLDLRQSTQGELLRHAHHLRDEYRKSEPPSINYHDPACRFVYLHGYVPIHAQIVYNSLRTGPGLAEFLRRRLENSGTLRVCAFGGGPGTELLALSRMFFEHNISVSEGDLEFSVIDQETAWADSFHHVQKLAKENLKRHTDVRLSSAIFQAFDMTKLDKFFNVPCIFDHDLFIVNYVASELRDRARLQQLQTVLEAMGERSPEGAHLVMIDRAASAPQVHELLSNTPTWNLYDWDAERQARLPWYEERRVLAPYSAMMGGWQPSTQHLICRGYAVKGAGAVPTLAASNER